MTDIATLSYRVDRLDKGHDLLEQRMGDHDERLAVHDEQISGAGGLVNAMERLGSKVDSLNKALYAFAGSFIVAAITIALAVQGH